MSIHFLGQITKDLFQAIRHVDNIPTISGNLIPLSLSGDNIDFLLEMTNSSGELSSYCQEFAFILRREKSWFPPNSIEINESIQVKKCVLMITDPGIYVIYPFLGILPDEIVLHLDEIWKETEESHLLIMNLLDNFGKIRFFNWTQNIEIEI